MYPVIAIAIVVGGVTRGGGGNASLLTNRLDPEPIQSHAIDDHARHEAQVPVRQRRVRSVQGGFGVAHHAPRPRPSRSSSSSLSRATMFTNDSSVPGSASRYKCRVDSTYPAISYVILKKVKVERRRCCCRCRRRRPSALSMSSMSSSDDKVVMLTWRAPVEDVLPLGHHSASGRQDRDVGADVVIIVVVVFVGVDFCLALPYGYRAPRS